MGMWYNPGHEDRRCLLAEERSVFAGYAVFEGSLEVGVGLDAP